jgi:phage shock protein A
MGFFGMLWARIKGFFIGAGGELVSGSPEAIRATYAAAIDDAKKRYIEMEKAVALLARERERTELQLKDLDKEEAELNRKLEGALAAAEREPTNSSHREAGTRYLSRIKEIDLKQGQLQQDLEGQRNKVEGYKVKLRGLMDEIDRLKREQGEMVAEFITNRQVIELENRLKGLAETSSDEALVAVREKVSGLRAQAKIATEMGGATLQAQDEDYERMGRQQEATSRFDDLLKARAGTKAGVTDKERDLG